MGDFWNSLISSLCGSLVGALGAYWVAMRNARHQAEAARELEQQAQQRALALQFLQQADEYVHLSFRPDSQCREARQKAGRMLLTSALLVIPDKVREIAQIQASVERFHKGKRGTSFSEVLRCFECIRDDLSLKVFQVQIPSSVESEEIAPTVTANK